MLDCLLSLIAVLGSLIFTGYVGVLLGCRSRPCPCGISPC